MIGGTGDAKAGHGFRAQTSATSRTSERTSFIGGCLIWTLGAVLLAFSLLSVWLAPINGYVLSFYASLPGVAMPAIWAAFLLFALGLIIPPINLQRRLRGAFLLGMTLVSYALLSLPTFLYGTYYTQWDVWYHLGYASGTAATGYVNVGNVFYPSLHILWAMLGDTSGLGVHNVGLVLGPLIFALKVPIVYIATSRAFHNARVASISAMLAVVPDGLTGVFPAPWFYALILLLLLLWVVLSRQDLKIIDSTILTLTVVTACVLSHPLAPLFLFAAVLIVFLTPRLLLLTKHVPTPSPTQERRPRSALPSLLVYGVVLYLTWISLLTLELQVQVPRILDALTVGGVINPIRYGHFLTPFLVVATYGTTMALVLFACLAVLVLWLGRENESRAQGYTVFSFVISASILMAATQAIGAGLGLGENVTRSISFAMMFLPILAAYFLGWVWARRPKSRGLAMSMVAIVLTLVVAGSATMYPSPGTALFNYQNTEDLYASIDWAAAHLPQGVSVLSNSHVGRYAVYPLEAGDPAFSKLVHFNDSIPEEISSFWQPQGPNRYLLLDEETVAVASADLRAWNSPKFADIVALNSVQNVIRLYDDGGVQVYLSGSG